MDNGPMSSGPEWTIIKLVNQKPTVRRYMLVLARKESCGVRRLWLARVAAVLDLGPAAPLSPPRH